MRRRLANILCYVNDRRWTEKPTMCRNLSELTLVSTCGVCGFIYVAISVCYEGADVSLPSRPTMPVHLSRDHMRPELPI